MVSVREKEASSVEQRLRSSGIALPTPPIPLGAYVEAQHSGYWLILSGMLPIADGQPRFIGRLGAELTTRDGYEAARIACLNGLATVKEALGSLDKVARVAKLGVYVAAEADYKEHAKVADGASELLLLAFGPDLLPPRVVLGVASLPLGLSVEVELMFELEDVNRERERK